MKTGPSQVFHMWICNVLFREEGIRDVKRYQQSRINFRGSTLTSSRESQRKFLKTIHSITWTTITLDFFSRIYDWTRFQVNSEFMSLFSSSKPEHGKPSVTIQRPNSTTKNRKLNYSAENFLDTITFLVFDVVPSGMIYLSELETISKQFSDDDFSNG